MVDIYRSSMKKQLMKSSFFRVVEIAIATTISLLLTPYLIHHLGDANYGLWILILSALGWFSFIDLGFSDAVQRNIVLALEKLDNDRINVVFSVAVVLFAVLGGAAAFLVTLLAYFPSILGVEDSHQSIVTVALSILAIKVFLDFVMSCFHGFYNGYLRMDIDANLSTLNSVIKAVLVYVLIIDMNIYGAVLATMVADIITHSLKVYFAKKLHPSFKFQFSLVNFSEVKHLFAYSKHLIAAGIASTLNRKIDPIIISHILGLKYVALYSVINSLITQVESLVSAFVGVFRPVFIRLTARNIDASNMFKQVLSINFFVVLIFYVPLAILAEDFILLWIGPEYAKGAPLAYILGFAYMCKTVSRPIGSMLMAQAKHKLLAPVHLIGALINIILSLWLGALWGIKGIAVATACGFFVADVILHLVLLSRYTNISIKPPFIRFCLIVMTFIAFTQLGNYILTFFLPFSWIELFLAAGICVFVVLSFAWPFILENEIRSKLLKMVLRGNS
jgi:O-antigen/teichoic acid export membrane protein